MHPTPPTPTSPSPSSEGFAWAHLLHLGYNMWEDRDAPGREKRSIRPYLRCDQALWDELTEKFARVGGNLLVIDLGEGVRYDSHPELACENAWTPAKLKAEIQRLANLGIEAIPKLNFSTVHDAWLGPYARCVSTDTYYAVCRDLIAEVIDLFNRPRLFHLGMDEETYGHQKDYAIAIVRHGDLWWHDLRFLVEQVERHNVRAWVWADRIWHHRDEYLRNMPKSVLQSNWYYAEKFTRKHPRVRAYLDLEAHGYDQVPTGSSYYNTPSFPNTVRYLRRRIAPERLHGFMQTPWWPTLPEFRDAHLASLDAVAQGIALHKPRA